MTTFDCVHDMTHPQEVMGAIRAALRDDGVWLLVDMKARDTFAENAAKNPMAALMYGVSVLSCLSSGSRARRSGSSAPSACRSRRLGRWPRRPGSPARRLDIEHPINALYELRP